MTDYSDIDPDRFVSFDRIRSRDVADEIVSFFDLVNNSGPGLLQLDPVLVTYDLAAASSGPREITLQSPTYRRGSSTIADTLTLDGTTNEQFFSSATGANNGADIRDTSSVRRILSGSVFFDLSNLTGNCALRAYIEIDDVVVTQSAFWYSAESNTNFTGYSEITSAGGIDNASQIDFRGIVIPQNANLLFSIQPVNADAVDVEVFADFVIEQRLQT